MKWLFVVAGFLVALVAVLAIIGALRPADHVASITAQLPVSDSSAWAVVSDFEKVPTWFADVTRVERIADVDGKPAYREQYGGFAVTNVVLAWDPPRKLVREILPSGSFSGTWTIELSPDGTGCRITITEHGHVGNPLFRAMMMFADNQKTMRHYVEALRGKLNAQD